MFSTGFTLFGALLHFPLMFTIFFMHGYLCYFILDEVPSINPSANDCNWTRTQNHLVRKRTLNQLGQIGKMVECSFTN